MSTPFARADMPIKQLLHRHITTICRRHRHIRKLDAAIAVNLKELGYDG